MPAHTHGQLHDSGSGRSGLVERGAERRSLRLVLLITGLFMVAEVVGGIVANSLALLADAGHMFTDLAALGLASWAMRLSQSPPSPQRTYGYVRMEVLAALANGSALLVIAGLICWEAVQRLRDPVEVAAPLMLAVAFMGLGVNVVGAVLLHAHSRSNLNVRGAYLHVLGDLLGSVGAIVAGTVILLTGWTLADPVMSVAIAFLLLVGAWRLVRESTDVLMEAAPRHVDVRDVLDDLGSIPGLHDVHDLHVWTLTSGFVALSAHGVVDDPREQAEVLAEIRRRLADRGIEHVTFQLESRPLYQIPAAKNGKEEGGEGVKRGS